MFQAPEGVVRLRDSNLNANRSASTNMRSMRSMWSCMGNVQSEVGPVVYCMQASAEAISAAREVLHGRLDELCAQQCVVGGKLLVLEGSENRRIGGAIPPSTPDSHQFRCRASYAQPVAQLPLGFRSGAWACASAVRYLQTQRCYPVRIVRTDLRARCLARLTCRQHVRGAGTSSNCRRRNACMPSGTTAVYR